MTLTFPDPSSLKILVAEDDNISRRLLGMLLQKVAGCEPDLVATGEEAHVVARENSYDLIFMDYNMPGTSGADAVRQIRNDPAIVKQPFIVGISALFGDDVARFENAGLDRYLEKPITMQCLKSVFSA